MAMKNRTKNSGCLLCGAKRSKMVHKFESLPKSRRGKQKLDIKQCSKFFDVFVGNVDANHMEENIRTS